MFVVGSRSSFPSFSTTATTATTAASTTTNFSTTNRNDNDTKVRLSKLLSQHSPTLAISRREAERLITSGFVTVAGQEITSPHCLLEWKDLLRTSSSPVGHIKVHGKAVAIAAGDGDKNNKTNSDDSDNSSNSNNTKTVKVWIVHKLKGEVVADHDPQGRPTLMERLRASGVGQFGKNVRHHLKPIGRLDVNTEGLILVTTCGHCARQMELPASQLHRTYRVRVHGALTRHKVQTIQRGMTLPDEHNNHKTRHEPMKVELEKGKLNSSNLWIRMTCAEGKNRQIRNVLKRLGCT